VDITAPGLRSVLNALVEASAADLGEGRDIFVKVSPPIHIKVIIPPSMLRSSSLYAVGRSSSSPRYYFPSSHKRPTSSNNVLPSTFHYSSKSTTTTTWEFLESFMSSWTRLVGDPIMSKWIVVMLAISISLNGYLLKGIAAGVVGGRFANVVGFGKGGTVRFEELEEDIAEDDVGQIVVIPPEMDKEPEIEQHMSSEAGKALARASFAMEEVDRKLQTASLLISSSSSSSSLDESSASSISSTNNKMGPIRSLDECIDIFENGPRPLSVSLALLNDEEIILLSQKGKVAAYALEKVLGPADLERAVRIRRALICKFFSFFLSFGFHNF
jgi:hydroxymethylglutaryl-CoA reductase (NADPH)